jgi:hypothetical protein
MARRAKRTPWYHDFRKRLRFEAGVRKEFADVKDRKIGKGWQAEIVYDLTVDVPEYAERRKVTIRLTNFADPTLKSVTVDGSCESPHRRGKTDLCLWRWDAEPERQWTGDEGLLALIQYVRIHLFREAYWRETGGYDGGIWAGDEAPHGDAKDEAA